MKIFLCSREQYAYGEVKTCVYTRRHYQPEKETTENGYCWSLCTRERANTKWKLYKLTNLTVFAALLKDVPMGCKDSVLPEPHFKNQNVNCLTYERNTKKPYKDNLCLFRALALHLHGNERLEEETSKIFNLFRNKCGEADPSKFQGGHMTDISKVEEMLQLNIFLYDIDFVDGKLILGTSTKKYSKIWKEHQTFTLQQSHLLRQRHELLLQIFSLQLMWHNLFKDWKFRAKFDYM